MFIEKIEYKDKEYIIRYGQTKKMVLSESTFVRFNLYKGKEISEDEILEIKKNNENQKAIDFILHKLKNRKTRKEIYQLLNTQNFPSESIEFVLSYLEKYKYIDDLEYSRLFTRDKIKLNLYGPKKISYLLYKKGISKNIIKEALEEYSQEKIDKNIRKLLEKKGYGDSPPIEFKEKNKLCNFLIQKGFSIEDVLKNFKRRGL